MEVRPGVSLGLWYDKSRHCRWAVLVTRVSSLVRLDAGDELISFLSSEFMASGLNLKVRRWL